MPAAALPSLRQSLVARLRFICKPKVVRKALLAAGLAGIVLVSMPHPL